VILMKLNRKGYMLVEIIVSFVLAFSIAMYLLNLTIKFKDTNEDIYYSTRYLKDKNLITRGIMSDLENFVISEVLVNRGENEDVLILKFGSLVGEEVLNDRKIVVNRDTNTITYGTINYDVVDPTVSYFLEDSSYYTKKLESSLIIGKMVSCDDEDIMDVSDGYFCVRIPISSMYDDYSYDINLFSTNIQSIV